jgi:DNA polymerase-1
MLAAMLLRTPAGPYRLGLDSITEFFLGEKLSKEQQTGDFGKELSIEQIRYAARDAEVLLRLRGVMIPALTKNSLETAAEIEFSCTRAVSEIETEGMLLDTEKWMDLTGKTRRELGEAEERLYRYTNKPVVQPDFFGSETQTGINFNSNKQVLEMLIKHGIEAEDTSRQALAPYKDEPIVQDLKEYRRLSKLLNGFLEPMPGYIHPETGRIHADYNQIGAYSGRMSCQSPNMQQIPRSAEFRDCFIPAPGKQLIIADYSQIELRVAAQISGDERMMEAYMKNGDLHKLTASLITGVPVENITKKQRQAAKAVNFGLIYAMGSRGLMAYARDTYDVGMTLEEAENFKTRFFEAYGGIRRWHEEIKKNPPSVSRSLGRRIYYHGEDTGLAALYNIPVQGSAADIIKKALGMLVYTLKGTGSRIIAVVHDEILLETPVENALKAAGILRETMIEAGSGFMPDVPLAADAHVASSWAEK